MPTSRMPPGTEDLATHLVGWHELAACHGREELFVHDNWREAKPVVAQAMLICQKCPVYRECRDWSATIQNWSGVVIGGVYYSVNGKRYEI